MASGGLRTLFCHSWWRWPFVEEPKDEAMHALGNLVLLTQCLYLGNSLAALDSQLEEMLIHALPLAASSCTHDSGKIVQKGCGTCLEPFHVVCYSGSYNQIRNENINID